MRSKLFITLTLLVFIATVSYAQSVVVRISDGVDSQSIQARIESNASSLLSEINAACKQNRGLNLSGLHLDPMVGEAIEMLWDNNHFCTEDAIVEHGISTPSGYQIRNIPLFIKMSSTSTDSDEDYQEGVMSFNKNGEIESFYLTISTNLYMKVIRDGKDVTDLRRRQLILDYVERFRTSYNQKDLVFLTNVFSDDALIITGRVVKCTQSDIKLNSKEKVVYNKYTKEQYLANVKRLFTNNKYIHVTFDDIKVKRHGTNPNVFGVTLHQGWSSSNYSDDGYLFLLWDFTNEDAPKIHVRTWQPDKYDGHEIEEKEIFSLSDFSGLTIN